MIMLKRNKKQDRFRKKLLKWYPPWKLVNKVPIIIFGIFIFPVMLESGRRARKNCQFFGAFYNASHARKLATSCKMDGFSRCANTRSTVLSELPSGTCCVVPYCIEVHC